MTDQEDPLHRPRVAARILGPAWFCVGIAAIAQGVGATESIGFQLMTLGLGTVFVALGGAATYFAFFAARR